MFWLFAGLLVVCFGFIVFRGAPYVPTHKKQVEIALDLLDLKPGEVFVDLGSGDGVLLKAAAKRGIVAHGYELNPFLCIISYLRCWPERDLVHIHAKDFLLSALPANTKGVFAFTAGPFVKNLEAKLTKDARGGGGFKFVSYGFELPGRKSVKTQNGLHLYKIN